MKNRIAIATCEKLAALTPSDRLAVEELQRLGIEAIPVVWSSYSDLSHFDAIIIRSTWDYWLRYEQFIKWIDSLSANGIRVWNSPSLIKWNSDKRYLIELSRKGVQMIETEWIAPGDYSSLKRLSLKHTEGFVVKPVVSGGAYCTYKIMATEKTELSSVFESVWHHGPAMVQPFLQAIINEGEYSFMFFGGQYAGTVLKRPKQGDYRVQPDHGGVNAAVVPSPEWIAKARLVLDSLEELPLYARVDMVNHNGSLQLMELELIEPNLFFLEDPQRALLFANKIAEFLRR